MAGNFDFEAWAEKQTPEVRSAFAGTCAARALPAIGGINRPEGLTNKQSDLILCRAILTSFVRGRYATTNVRAARSALAAARSTRDATESSGLSTLFARSAFSAADSALSAAGAAHSAAYSALSAGIAVGYSDVETVSNYAARSGADSAASDGVTGLLKNPLWFGNDIRVGVREIWPTLRAEWRENGHMSFWIDWYEGLLEGREPDWVLWRRIAEIVDDKWDSGPEAVAAEIEQIKEDLKQERIEDWMPQAKSAIARAETLAPLAKLQAQVIEDTLTAIVKQIDSTDKIPNELEPIDRLRSKLIGLSIELSATKSDEDQTKIVAQIIREMYLTICDLNDRLHRSRSWAERHPWKAETISGTVAAALGGIATGVAMIFLGGADTEVQQVINNTYNNKIQLCTADDMVEPRTLPYGQEV